MNTSIYYSVRLRTRIPEDKYERKQGLGLKHGMLARQVIHYVSQDGPIPNHIGTVEQLCTCL